MPASAGPRLARAKLSASAWAAMRLRALTSEPPGGCARGARARRHRRQVSGCGGAAQKGREGAGLSEPGHRT